jgi:hypothetical protein
VTLLRVDDAVRVGLGAEVALQAEDDDGEGLRGKALADLFNPLLFLFLKSGVCSWREEALGWRFGERGFHEPGVACLSGIGGY